MTPNQGPIQAVIFDWAGTTVDHGSLAPIQAITELFARHGVVLDEAEARRDMGLAKRDHIARIVAARSGADAAGMSAQMHSQVDALYAEFLPLQMGILAAHAALIPGVAAMAESLRARGIKLGATTGYTRPMLDLLAAAAAKEGYRPDVALCPGDVGGGRPAPWMCLRLGLEFRLSSMAAAVKIGDTPSDVAEGCNAGMWTVGVAATGNEVGLSAAALAALPAAERARRIETARSRLLAAGAHAVVEGAADCEPALAEIAARLRAGQRP